MKQAHANTPLKPSLKLQPTAAPPNTYKNRRPQNTTSLFKKKKKKRADKFSNIFKKT